MKRLLLLRHAKAVPATDPLVDFDRPLADRGERDAERIGERLRQQEPPPALILTSPAARALRTAQLVARTIDYPRDAIALDRRLKFRLDSSLAVAKSVEIVDALFTESGGRAIFLSSPLHRAFLDIHSARAHYATNVG